MNQQRRSAILSAVMMGQDSIDGEAITDAMIAEARGAAPAPTASVPTQEAEDDPDPPAAPTPSPPAPVVQAQDHRAGFELTGSEFDPDTDSNDGGLEGVDFEWVDGEDLLTLAKEAVEGDIDDLESRWCGGKRRAKNVQCPNPNHADNNPSAEIKPDGVICYSSFCAATAGDSSMAKRYDAIDLYAFGVLGFDEDYGRTAELFGQALAGVLRDEVLVGADVHQTGGYIRVTMPNGQVLANRVKVPLEGGSGALSTAAAQVVPGSNVRSFDKGSRGMLLDPATFEPPSIPRIPEDFIAPDTLPAIMLAAAVDTEVWVPDEFTIAMAFVAGAMFSYGNATLQGSPHIAFASPFLVGPSGVGKSTAMKRCSRAIAAAQNEPDPDDPEDENANWVDGIVSGERMLDTLGREGDPIQPKMCVIAYDESKTLFKELSNRRGNTLATSVLNLMAGDDVAFSSRSSKDMGKAGVARADNYRACLVTGVQPNQITKVMDPNAVGEGVVNRFLPFPADMANEPERIDLTLHELPTYRAYDDTDIIAELSRLHSMWARIRSAVTTSDGVREWRRQGTISMTNEAARISYQHESACRALRARSDEHSSDVLGRAHMMNKRVATMLAIWEKVDIIDGPMMLRATRFVEEYTIPALLAFGAQVGSDQLGALSDRVIKTLNRRWDIHQDRGGQAAYSGAQLRNYLALPKDFNPSEFERLLNTLVRQGDIAAHPSTRGVNFYAAPAVPKECLANCTHKGT